MRSIVKEFILPWKALLGFGLVIAIVGGAQWGAAAVVNANTFSATNVACTLKAFDNNNVNVLMKVDCGGSEDSTKDAAFIAAYLQKPGTFTCTRYNWAYADCKLQEAAKAN